MPGVLDRDAVRRFTDDLNDRMRQCDYGEGMFCSTLDDSISHYAQLCIELRAFIQDWARSVFTGASAFDVEVENALKTEVRHLLVRAKAKAALGRAMDEQCFKLARLADLHFHIANFDYLLENWISPRLAVSPAPRTPLPAAALEQARERLALLMPLPADWQPATAEQRSVLKKLRAE